MPFNHYAKIKRILKSTNQEWYVRRIDEPTVAKSFKGENRKFDHYYRVYYSNGGQIPYCKFQQIDLFAKIMDMDLASIEIHTS